MSGSGDDGLNSGFGPGHARPQPGGAPMPGSEDRTVWLPQVPPSPQQPPQYPGPAPSPGPPPAGSYPPFGPPPGIWPQPAPRRPRRWWIVSAVVAVLIVAAATVTVILVSDDCNQQAQSGSAATQSTTAPQQSEPPVPASALEKLLLTPEEAAKVVGVPSLSYIEPKPGVTVTESMYGTEIVDQHCLAPAFPVTRAAYAGSGYLGVRKASLQADPDRGPYVSQGVVSYADPERADSFFADSKAVWEKCADRIINERRANKPDDPDEFWQFGPVTDTDGLLRTFRYLEGGSGWVCQRGMAVRSNVIVDFYVCGDDMSEAVVSEFAESVTRKIEKLR